MNGSNSAQDWMLLAPSGYLAIARRPLASIPEGARLATGAELLVANQGKPFPWGHLATPEKASRLWQKFRVGAGGLIHDRWFLTTDGRLGGAPNVPETLPGSLRSSMLYDGGKYPEDYGLCENEGYAVVRTTTAEDQQLYREVQLYAARHVMADGGAIILSPISESGKIFVGFVGRCQYCPNAELISFNQLKDKLPKYQFELWPEWRNWTIANSTPLLSAEGEGNHLAQSAAATEHSKGL